MVERSALRNVVHGGPYSVLGGRWKGEEVEATYARLMSQLRGKIPISEYEMVAASMSIQMDSTLGIGYVLPNGRAQNI